jgi:hypothetical protein
MKKLLIVLLFGYQAVQAQYPTDKDPFMTKSLSAESIKQVEAETSGGSISVTGVAATEARIEVFVWASNNGRDNKPSKEEIQQRLSEYYDLNIGVTSNKLTAIAKSKQQIRDWKKSLSISFKIFVPKQVSSHLLTSGGSISLSELTGTQDFTTSGGSLHIDNLGGKMTGRTSGGSIHVSDSKDDIDLTTSGGSIEASNCNGNIRLVTSGGSVRINDLQGDVKATTSGGSIHGNNITGELSAHTSGGNVALSDLACSVETSTSGGNINVGIKTLGKYVKISNSGGNITLEMPGDKGLDLTLRAGKIRTDKISNFSGTMEDDKVDGKLNNGGIPVTVHGGSGRLTLTLK